VGTVMKVSPADLFLRIRLHPAADLTRLEEVLVITKIQDVAPTSDLAASQRAVDILAQRLPGVPDKPAITDAAQSESSGERGTEAGAPARAASSKPNLPRVAAKPQVHPASPPPTPGPQAKPTQDSKPAPVLKPVAQRMQ
jgi:rod shape-determining protein MreC